jgi:hypothetical protein
VNEEDLLGPVGVEIWRAAPMGEPLTEAELLDEGTAVDVRRRGPHRCLVCQEPAGFAFVSRARDLETLTVLPAVWADLCGEHAVGLQRESGGGWYSPWR